MNEKKIMGWEGRLAKKNKAEGLGSRRWSLFYAPAFSFRVSCSNATPPRCVPLCENREEKKQRRLWKMNLFPVSRTYHTHTHT